MRLRINEQFWSELDGQDVYIGVNEDYLNLIGVLWNIIPTEFKKVAEGEPFCHVESSKRLIPFKTPFSGTVSEWNAGVVEQPETITADKWLVRITRPKEKKIEV